MMEAIFTWFFNLVFSALLQMFGIEIDVAGLLAGFGA